MGQLCCFPLSRPEDKLSKSVDGAPALDDEELVSLSKRLVEDAVLRAVQQYMEETQQNGAALRDQAPPGAASNLNTTK
uniref:A kinase (PRKA) anchor protein 7 n=1 Tax=Sinocyclocheilus rhinocerous TaxID=307959 RepID=A0A673H1X6_9TELE